MPADKLGSVVSRWRQAAQGWSRPEAGGVIAETSPGEEQSCPGLKRVLERLFGREDRPSILDLGSGCGPTAIFLADGGARVSVEAFEAPGAGKPGAEGEAPPPLVIDQPDARFDLVLAWEHPDFVAPARLGELGAELRRVMAPGGWLLLFAGDRPESEAARGARPGRYRVVSVDRLLREPGAGPERPRWVHATRDIERSLSPLSIQGIHLQRSRTREFLAFKAAR